MSTSRMYTSHEFLKLGNAYTKSSLSRSKPIALRRFKAFLGVSPAICSIIWRELSGDLPEGALPKHLLWGLSFLKQYATEHCRRSVFHSDEKTIRKWSWIFVKLLSDMHVIIWENRFDGAVHGQTCFVSLDGVDFRILEPIPFDKGWYSHKFRSAGLRYEIGLNIRTGYIVWKFGGYPCGAYLDLTIAREAYVHSVSPGERTMADKGYNDDFLFILPNDDNSPTHNLIMSRHETVNKRIKQFMVLKHEFRHELRKHPMCFHAVVNVTQLVLQNEQPLFSVNL